MLDAVRIRKAVIPAAGLGTRFLPATKAIPKEMIPLVDKPGIQYVIEEAVGAGITDILIVTGRSKKAIEDHFDRSFELEASLAASGKDEMVERMRSLAGLADIHYIRQEEPRGLGHAVGMGRRHVGDEPFVVMLPDDLMAEGSDALPRMLAAAEQREASVVGLMRFPPDEIGKYGVVATAGDVGADDVVRIVTTVEKPARGTEPSDLAIIGRYVLTPDVFDRIARLKPGAIGEIQLTDALCTMAEDGPFYGLVIDGGRYDIGNKLDWLRATIEVALHHPEVGPGFRTMLHELLTREGAARS
jgi:UTP--glucose-1-phosphate uridylyltransferase